MNKGRNIAILMACLLTVSLLGFLTHTTDSNETAVVDRVRYIQEDSRDGMIRYAFYFVGDRVMEGELSNQSDGSRRLVIYERIPPDEENYERIPYGYTYYITGTNLRNGTVSWEYAEGFDASFEEKPHERFSQRVFLTMVFGKASLVSVPQAVLVAAIAAGGALIIGYAEELWHFFKRKGSEEDPKWEELTVYKRVGGTAMGFAALLLVLFVIF